MRLAGYTRLCILCVWSTTSARTCPSARESLLLAPPPPYLTPTIPYSLVSLFSSPPPLSPSLPLSPFNISHLPLPHLPPSWCGYSRSLSARFLVSHSLTPFLSLFEHARPHTHTSVCALVSHSLTPFLSLFTSARTRTHAQTSVCALVSCSLTLFLLLLSSQISLLHGSVCVYLVTVCPLSFSDPLSVLACDITHMMLLDGSMSFQQAQVR